MILIAIAATFIVVVVLLVASVPPDARTQGPETKPRHIGPDYVRQPGQPGFNAMTFLGELMAEQMAKDIEQGNEPTMDRALNGALGTLDELEP